MTTIVDVARAAGVSTATVSRVLNNHPQVDPQLVATVTKAVKDLEYRPSRVARRLRTRQSQVWALIISDIRNPFFTDMVRGVEDVAYAAGYSLVLCNADEDPAKEASYLELAIAEHVGGVIFTPAGSNSDLSRLAARSIPVVLADRDIEGQGADVVMVDNAAGARAAVEHLLEGGYRRIACITGRLSITTAADRLAGYRAALEGAGLRVDPDLVRCGEFREAGGRQSMEELLTLSPRPDAVFVCNNLMTIGALHAITEAGLAIPAEIAVIGFDDMSWATLMRPRLTAVAQPTYDLGKETSRLLLDRIDGYTGAARRVTLAPVLRIRDSASPKAAVATGGAGTGC